MHMRHAVKEHTTSDQSRDTASGSSHDTSRDQSHDMQHVSSRQVSVARVKHVTLIVQHGLIMPCQIAEWPVVVHKSAKDQIRNERSRLGWKRELLAFCGASDVDAKASWEGSGSVGDRIIRVQDVFRKVGITAEKL
mmetsp:Transcript_17075/g.38301  ORF Transcript_17075/g.38301 Transcript_17075/m.38301 type:complete len:136 (-) Transcript_17075:72-479(-)|eukprot:CAMPEP_0181209446 /NCGR_PEP_ID=MMETSP1096-20121128/22673_1 /TAXON_ID=156174 ORGANISM="Chrysochromulina ericina, Strain CCMP281" /NCGR_SAMPLE_ID=MMETSP1096 /ASSEMBLY_ACC=CAM_ASM_000453 /LENGTH=135 /DNA_ID=CAMNT_0023300613 /DNA_START=223 /DNA_END=630 /DNA_ORIENTATION=-